MIPREILKKVRRLEITTRGLVNEVFSGEYHSVFKGRGMDFSEVREYQFGDDIRTIDWNVTARMGHPFVKIFEEERELTVMLAVDVSASGDFGSAAQMKGEIAVEICALLAFSAIKNNDKVGLIIFSDRIEKFIPPRKGRRHVLRVLRELLYFQPTGRQTDIRLGLEYLGRVVRRRAVVFLVSDFIATNFERALSIAGRRHDLIAVQLSDPREHELPDMGLVEFEDAETGEHCLLDTSDAEVRDAFFRGVRQRLEALENLFKKSGVDRVPVRTDQGYVDPLIRFFQARNRRIQSGL